MGEGGILFLLLVVFVGFWVIMSTIETKVNARREAAAEEEKKRLEQAEAARKQVEAQRTAQIRAQKMKPQRDLILRYTKSELTQQVIQVICDGNPGLCMPEEITIRDDSIQSRLGNKLLCYDFAANRVHNFTHVHEYCRPPEEKEFVVKPQMAMAEAINSLLGGKYSILDRAKIDHSSFQDIDGDLHYTCTYISDHVIMKLASTLPNKSF